MDTYGSLATLRHGFKCYGRTLRVAFFKAAHGLNPELEERYAKNRVGITRQLHFSARNEKSLDVVLSVNGIPVATVELKNPLTGQTVEDAMRQYRLDRDPREPIFDFKRRTLVHFAVDTEQVFMTTRLAGTATHFLPFNKATMVAREIRQTRTAAITARLICGRRYSNATSLLDMLARFLHLQIEAKRDDQGRKVKKETMVFPRITSSKPCAVWKPPRERKGRGIIISSNIRRAAARATQSAGSRTGSPRCTTRRNSAFLIR